jgi:tRNA (uracil-5-)-methyltransferase
LGGIRFRISHSAFFQVNTAAFEVLLQRLQQWVQPDSNTVIFDVCCGTGSLGLSMAKSCSHVVGVEMVQSAVRDAEANAAANGDSSAPHPNAASDPNIGFTQA